MADLSSLFSILGLRGRFLILMNLLFFGAVFITTLVSGLFLPPQLYTGQSGGFSRGFFSDNLILEVLSILLFNLVMASLGVVTLPGFALFPLSGVFLVYRAFIWGLFIYQSPNSVFLVALPTLVLEGEGYAFAAVAGTLVGMSWIRPEWIYKGENISKMESLKKALRESAWLYVLVVMVLFVAAVVETATLALIR